MNEEGLMAPTDYGNFIGHDSSWEEKGSWEEYKLYSSGIGIGTSTV